jgi:hypothetical protein
MSSIPGPKAQSVLAGFVQRVTQVNVNPELTHYAQGLHFFGGLLEQAISKINVLLAIQLEWRTTPNFLGNKMG